MEKRTNTASWDEKNRRWRISVQRDGQRRSFYSSTPGRTGQREANAKADRWLESGVNAAGATVASVYPEWIKRLQTTTSASNWRPIDSRWRKWIDPAIGGKKLDRITEQNLQDIVDAAFAAGLSKKTLTSMCCDLRAFFKFCRRSKLTTFSPEDLTIPAGARNKGKEILQPADLVKLFNIDTTTRWGKRVPEEYIHAYRVQVLTGLRPGELLGLEWSDLKGHTLHVQRSINCRGEVTKGKNENAVRSVQLPDLAFAEIQAQRAMTGHSKQIFGISNQQNYAKRWAVYCAANGLTPVSPYELRHTFVSIAQVLPEGQVKRLVGHSRSMDTFGIYGHSVDGQDEQAADTLGGVFSLLLGRQA